jgi:hypothetical protein
MSAHSRFTWDTGGVPDMEAQALSIFLSLSRALQKVDREKEKGKGHKMDHMELYGSRPERQVVVQHNLSLLLGALPLNR